MYTYSKVLLKVSCRLINGKVIRNSTAYHFGHNPVKPDQELSGITRLQIKQPLKMTALTTQSSRFPSHNNVNSYLNAIKASPSSPPTMCTPPSGMERPRK